LNLTLHRQVRENILPIERLSDRRSRRKQMAKMTEFVGGAGGGSGVELPRSAELIMQWIDEYAGSGVHPYARGLNDCTDPVAHRDRLVAVWMVHNNPIRVR
jgi:hypothetical protein